MKAFTKLRNYLLIGSVAAGAHFYPYAEDLWLKTEQLDKDTFYNTLVEIRKRKISMDMKNKKYFWTFIPGPIKNYLTNEKAMNWIDGELLPYLEVDNKKFHKSLRSYKEYDE